MTPHLIEFLKAQNISPETYETFSSWQQLDLARQAQVAAQQANASKISAFQAALSQTTYADQLEAERRAQRQH